MPDQLFQRPEPALSRWLRRSLVSLLVLLAGVLVWLAVTRHSTNDAYRALLAVAAACGLAPLLIRDRRLARWRHDNRSMGRRLHDWIFAHPVRFSLVIAGFWLVTHGLYSATLADPNYGADMRYFVQAAANAVDPRGAQWLTIDERPPHSFFCHHFEPFLYLLRPVAHLPLPTFWFAAIQDLAQGLFLLLALFVIKERVAMPQARLVCLFCLLINPFWTGLIHYEFHEYGLAPPLILLAYFAFRRQSLLGWIAACAGLLCLKETLAINLLWAGGLITVVGAYRREWLRSGMGVIAIALALTAYILYFRVILPSVAGREWTMFSGYYSHLGGNMVEIACSPVLRPAAFWSTVSSHGALTWLLTWTLAVGGIGMLGWRWWILIVPELAIVMLSSLDNVQSTVFQYGAVLLPMSVLAMTDGVGSIVRSNRISLRQRGMVLGLAMILAAAVASTPVPKRLFALIGSDGIRSIPFVLGIPADVPIATNTFAGCMHASARPDVLCRSVPLKQPPGEEALKIRQDYAVYLLHDAYHCTGRENLVELRRHGAWAIYRLADEPPADSATR